MTLEAGLVGETPPEFDVVDLDRALTRLAAVHPRAARVVECRFFGGLSVLGTAEVVAIAERTVKRDWSHARAWLYRELATYGHE